MSHLTASDRRHRRVVITGMGVISPAGCTLEDYWRGLTCGRSAIRNVTRFDTSSLDVHTAGEVDFGPFEAQVPRTCLHHPDFSIKMGLVAARQALEDAGLLDAARNGVRIGALIGTGLGPCDTVAASYKAYDTHGQRAVRPTTIPRCMFNGIASEASIAFQLTGSHSVTAAACASASMAMCEAYEAVLCGREDVVLTGGCDSPLTLSIYIAWANLRVLSDEPDPARAMRPFDRGRKGFVLSEGAGMLIFEELEHARRRGARIYAEVIGHGTSSDATHITKPNAQGQAEAIRRAMRSAGIVPEDVDYINAHGTATLLNDPTETEAIKMALGHRAFHVPISSTKSVIGHAMGASGALELIATILAMQNQVVPPTVNLDDPDPACDLDYVPNEPRPAPIRIALKNSFAFGGSNCVLVVSSYKGDPHG